MRAPRGRDRACWGSNVLGQLGGDGPDRLAPRAVPGLDGVRVIAAGAANTCAILEDGTVRCWGSDRGLGFSGPCVRPAKVRSREGPLRLCSTPTAVPGLAGVARLSLNEGMSCARTAAGEVFCWGTAAGSVTPVRVPL